ncbi:hypothetical protein [Pseudomonas frederiksbergensis]|uniref:hypothetical protein n=1 Tax=Pseudomonas frederiksbergensis TaxID=104087 RepID=UPI002DB57C18|nr:hypothetical protein [Pseudomonas frederiksbergensis]WRV69727.1 hypothetical protein VQ575_06635 [Pseudomonas frederiksbergensis]
MNRLYGGLDQEHIINELNSSVILVGAEELEGEVLTYVKATEKNLEVVVRLYSEKIRGSGRSVSICVSADNYAERYDLARAYSAGLYFINGAHIESLKGFSSFEIDEYAASAGALKNGKRFIESIARQVPFLITREKAFEKITAAMMCCEFADLDEALEGASNFFKKTVDRDVRRYQQSTKITTDSQIVAHFLTQKKPGPAASEELESYAKRIFVEGGIHVLGDGLGKGKTLHVIRNVIADGILSGKKPTFLTHRIAVARSNAISDLVEQYSDEKIEGREDQLHALSLIVNKCDHERYKPHLAQSDILVIDEGSQVVRHLMQKGFTGDRYSVFHQIVSLMKTARLVLVCEAFVNDVLMNFIRLAGRPIHYTQGLTDYSGVNICLASVESTQREILRSLTANRRIVVGTDSRRIAETVAKIAKDRGKRVLLLTQKTKDYPEVRRFLDNPNVEAKKYDVLTHSPSMQSSVSITETHFDDHFCIFNGVVSVDDAKQFTRRDRTSEKITVGISSITTYCVERKGCIELFNASGDTIFDSISIECIRLRSLEKNNFQQWLSLSFELDGFTITRLGTEQDADAEAVKIFKNGRKEVKEKVIAGTVNAGIAALITGNEDRIKGVLSDSDYYHNHFLAVVDATGKAREDINENDIKFYNEGIGVPKIRNMACWVLDETDFEKMKSHDESIGIDSKHYQLSRRMISGALDRLGIDKEGRGIIHSHGLEETCAFILQNELNFKQLRLINTKINVKTERQRYSIVTELLKSLGLSKVRVMIEGVRVYKLCQKRYLQMLSYTDRKRHVELTVVSWDQAEKVQQIIECDLDLGIAMDDCKPITQKLRFDQKALNNK